MTKQTADQLAAEGQRLALKGQMVVFLNPSEEVLAVETQTPFVRYERIPLATEEPKR